MLNPVTNIAKGGIHMEARAVLRYARISPRKVKIVLDLIRNKPAKRIQPHAQGRAFKILKRTSHITLVLKEMED